MGKDGHRLGTMQGGPNQTFSYANAYITSNWVNFSSKRDLDFRLEPLAAVCGE